MNESVTQSWAIAMTLSKEIDAIADDGDTDFCDDTEVSDMLCQHPGAMDGSMSVDRAVDLLLGRQAAPLSERAYGAITSGVERAVAARPARLLRNLQTLQEQLSQVADGGDQPRAGAAQELQDHLTNLEVGRDPESSDARQIVRCVEESGIDMMVASAGLWAAHDLRQPHQLSGRELALLGVGDDKVGKILELVDRELERRTLDEQGSD